MKISFVSIEDGITALGFRKMASFARSIHPSTEVCYLPLTNAYNPLRFLLKPGKHDRVYSDADLDSIASHFAKSDLVCFSSMTAYSDLTKEIIQLTKKINPKTRIEITDNVTPNLGYTLSNRKLLNTGFKFLYNVEDSIQQMISQWLFK